MNVVPVLFFLYFSFYFFLLFFIPVETQDVWWLLSTGKWISSHIQVPHIDLFPFGDEQNPWVCYEWLGCVILYWIHELGGLFGLKLFRALFFIGSIGIFVAYAYRKIPSSLLTVLTLVFAYGLLSRGWLRPDMFNMFFLQILLINLFAYENTGDRRRLLILPVVGVAWFNIHIGAFIYGASIIGIFLLSAGLRLLNTRLKSSQETTHALKQTKDFAVLLCAYLAFFVINPYGLEGFLYPIKTFLMPGFIDFYKISGTIGETQPAAHIFLSFAYAHFFIIFGLAVLTLAINRKYNFTMVVVLLVSLFAFLYMSRNSVFYTVAAVYVIAQGAERIGFNALWKRLPWTKVVDNCVLVAVALFLSIQIYLQWNTKTVYRDQVLRFVSVKSNIYSADVIKLLADHKIHGPAFNPDILGGQIIWSLYPSIRPFADGRWVDKERFNNDMALLENPQKVWPLAEQGYHFKIVILNAGDDTYFKLMHCLRTDQSWQLISVNGPLVVFVKRGEFLLTKELDQFEEKLRSTPLAEEDVGMLKKLVNRESPSFLGGFFNPAPVSVDRFSEGLSLMNLGFEGAAVKSLIEGLRWTDQPHIQDMARDVLRRLHFNK